MKSRSLHVRTKVLALLLSLTALWVFAAVVTVRDGLNLLWVNTMNEKIGKPDTSLVEDLQQERRLSVIYLATHSSAQHEALVEQRSRTDTALRRFRKSVNGRDVHWAASDELEGRIGQAITSLNGLGQIRGQVDGFQSDRGQAASGYTDIIDVQFQIYGSLTSFSSQDIAKEASTLVALDQAREVLSQEDALVSGALADGRFTSAELQQYVQLEGLQEYLYTQADAQLPPSVHAEYQRMADGPDYTRFTSVENQLRTGTRANQDPPISSATWQAAINPVNNALSNLVIDGANQAVKDAEPAAIWVLVRLILAGGLGLLAVIASVVVSVTTARSLVRQLERLRNAARELAEQRLPGVVARLQHGDEVDVAVEAPPLEFGNDEIGQLGQAFNAVQETAVRVAVEQAELRRSVRDVFLSLARRSQALVHRQLQLLDGMERREQPAEELDDLFKVDHLATRMRRNAENLIVLSGSVAGRGWRNPVPMVDVIRGAVGEVEEYARVTVLPIESAALAGRAVGDVIHLLAELIENAVSFSPPYTNVQVSGAMVANGFAVEIEDRGLGMSEADLVKANEQLSEPPEFNLTSTAQLGLFVVGRLAERHGVKVRLRESVYGGTTAIVLIPAALVVDPQDSAVRPGRRTGRGAVQVGEQVTGTELNGAANSPVPVSPAPAPLSPTPRPAPGGANARQAANSDSALLGQAGPRPHATSPDRLTGHRVAEAAPTRSPGRSPEGTGEAETPAGPAASRYGTATSESDRDTAVIQAITDDTVPPTDMARPQPPVPGQVGGALRGDGGRPGQPARPAQPEQPARPAGPAQPEQPARPASAAQPDGSDERVIMTAAGLPFRRRQASLAPALRNESAPGAQEAPRTNQPVRRPEEIRRIMSSYQTGTLRGREAADQAERSGAHAVQGTGQTGDPATNPAGPTVDPASRTGSPAGSTVDPASRIGSPAGSTVDPAGRIGSPAAEPANSPVSKLAGDHASHRVPDSSGGRAPAPGSPALPQPSADSADDQQP